MLLQLLFYELDILSFNNFTISIRVIYLLIALFLCCLIKNIKVFDILKKIIYFLILIGIFKIFIIEKGDNYLFESNVVSRLSFYFYNLFNYPLKSLNTFFMVYSHLYLMSFIFFYPIFKKHYYFLITIFAYLCLIILFNLLNITNLSIDIFQIILVCIGYLIGYLINNLNIKKTSQKS
ncbi:hypothetical protein OKW22_000704 [Bacilli bacterium PM5-3]|nr:hypothetical protein [Bacilli bacterium PM5-3]MDH6603800.1 hypothetical protein [Bacilli bacterium PM5-9]